MTQHQKIITLMARDRTNKWFYPYDFMPPRLEMSDQCFVGYEATARIAELRGKYPEMFETLPDGKYKKSRIKVDSIDSWFSILPKDLKQIIAKELDYYPHIPGNRFHKQPENPYKDHSIVEPKKTEQTTLLDVEPKRRYM